MLYKRWSNSGLARWLSARSRCSFCGEVKQLCRCAQLLSPRWSRLPWLSRCTCPPADSWLPYWQAIWLALGIVYAQGTLLERLALNGLIGISLPRIEAIAAVQCANRYFPLDRQIRKLLATLRDGK